MPRLTDVVKNLMIINVLMFIGTLMIMGDPGRMILAFNPPPGFQPYQIVTHMFMHGDMGHLLFNMFALFIFGPQIESYMGPKRFLFYYFVCGFGSLLLNFLLVPNGAMLGASGAIFGLLAAFGLLFPQQRISLIFPPISMKAYVFVSIYVVVELFFGVRGSNTGIAHFAHLGGGLAGALLILYWKYSKQ